MTEVSGRILVVDDERHTCQLLERVLRGEGYLVDTASDGPAALQWIARHRYDFAILDYKMPKMDGVELFGRIHQEQPQVVGIFLTGYPTIDTVFPAVNVGIHRVLSKPVDMQELLSVLGEGFHEPVSP